jgi:hypothetical protein
VPERVRGRPATGWSKNALPIKDLPGPILAFVVEVIDISGNRIPVSDLR